MKALESRLAQFGDRMNTTGPQSSLFLLPRLMRAAYERHGDRLDAA